MTLRSLVFGLKVTVLASQGTSFSLTSTLLTLKPLYQQRWSYISLQLNYKFWPKPTQTLKVISTGFPPATPTQTPWVLGIGVARVTTTRRLRLSPHTRTSFSISSANWLTGSTVASTKTTTST